MIQPLRQSSNINFRQNPSPALKAMAEKPKVQAETTTSQPVATEENAKSKKEKVSKFQEAKKKVTDFVKNVRTTTSVTTGTAKGLFEGALAAACVGIVGKNIAQAKDKQGLKVLTGTIGGALKDIGKVFSSGHKYLKGHKATAIAASITGAGVLAINIIKSKIDANVKNAETDHKYNTGHIK